jgi:hypothetical protein
MNGKKLFTHKINEIQNMNPNESKATLSNLIMEQEINRIKRIEAVKKCNRKRYASLKVQIELEKENKELLKEIERLQKENEELKRLKGFKESKQIEEIDNDDDDQPTYIIPEFEILDINTANKYIDEISDLLEELTGSENETINHNKYVSILKKNNLRKPSTYKLAERQNKQYKLILRAVKEEFDED